MVKDPKDKKVSRKGIGGSYPGNKKALKLKDSEVRQEAYRQYCAHIASGYPKQAFFFSHPKFSVCWKTMDRYIDENPAEFPTFLLDEAKSARFKHWLDEDGSIMRGGYKGGSPVVWQTIMRNIFRADGWDTEVMTDAGQRNLIRREIEAYKGDGEK